MRARIAVASALAVTLLGIAGAVPAAAHHPSVTEYPTLTVVTQGAVVVRDLARHRNVLVTAGHRYLARKRAHAARRRH
jgi:hypothetical protein